MRRAHIVAAAASPFVDDSARWAAVRHRDPSADGHFFYSVSTTGVYCRPSCPSRRARREHVSFHASCESAERAGFRPCKRCRPTQTGLAGERTALVARACRLIERAEAVPSLEFLARAVGLSRFHFHRVFTSVTGVTPKAYASAYRARRLREALDRRSTVTEAIYDSGFNSSGRFYATSTAVLGMTPSRYRAGGAGTVIRYAVGKCSLGRVLVAVTETGVCAILLGDDRDRLVREVQARFASAQVLAAGRQFEDLLRKVVALVESPRLGVDLPLDVRGTAFQQRVWQALRTIPAGSTATYAELARRIGAPNAVRAVARACGANPIAVAIPCHRVIRADGSLAGYRWGVERKRALLERESKRDAWRPVTEVK